jgi:hypothetical protein
MSPLTWNIDCGPDAVLVTVEGRADPASVGALGAMLEDRFARGPDALVVDTSRVSADAHGRWAGVQVVRHQGATAGGTVVVVHGPDIAGARAGNRPLGRCLRDTRTALITDRPGSTVLDDQLLPVSGAGRHGRNMVTEACAAADLPDVVGRAALVANELINYVAEAARTIMTFTIHQHGDTLYLAVRHGPVAGSPEGAGLVLVDMLSSHWGFLRADDDIVTWGAVPTAA